VVLLDANGFAVRADELRELGRNPIKDMSGLSSQTSRKEQVLWVGSPGAVNSTVLFVFFLRYLVPSSPSSVRFASTGPCFWRDEGMVGWLRLPDKEVCKPVDMGEAGFL
jgi:hypothetical protein